MTLDFHQRSSGILMHVTSLPGPHGCGDLGPEANRFVDLLADSGQSWWQMLPIGPPGRAPGFSPYDSASAFAGSPWLVSLDALARQGLIAKADLPPAPGLSSRQVNFLATLRLREERLRQAFANFQQRRGDRARGFLEFCDSNSDWLEDFALFMALRRDSGGKPWTQWESGVRQRQPSALRAARERLADEIAGHRFVQFEFDRQWRALRDHAKRRGTGLIGDLPIFVAQDSADVWSHPELFQLDRRGAARRVSGYPPDRFNRNGQHWGHPQYNWPAHKQTGFAWWVRRFARIFEFGFGSEPDSVDHLPHNYSRVCAAYTGNHDNDTTVGWFKHLRPAEQRRVRTYTGATETAPHAGAIRALMTSPANAVIFPMQDVLGLDQRARMNTPGTLEGNWQWRLPPTKLARSARNLRRLAESSGRTAHGRKS